MTHKDAIRDLNTIKDYFEQESGAYPISLEYAICVLKNDVERGIGYDLIKREDAIATIGVMYERCDTYDITDYRDLMLEAVKVLPSADRPQGEWIDAEIPLESGGSMPIQACNLCKTFYPLAYTGGGHRFCPNCGAKMKGADDE